MENFEIIAKTLFGFEEILANELKEIGANDIQILNRAIKYTGGLDILYKSNYLLRTAIKILKPISSFKVVNETQLYNKVKEIQWEKYLTIDNTFAIDGVSNSEIFSHSQYIALKSKDAIVDQFREKYGNRPSVDTEDPNIRINIHIADTLCTISLDSSGKSLGKRGYKLSQNLAPLSEVMAAGIIILSGWDKNSDFIDPMCGSGTFPIEAALIAKNIPAGSFRNFCFQNWNDFDEKLWESIKKDANSKIIDFKYKIYAYDSDSRSINISKENTERAGVEDLIKYENINFFKTKSQSENGTIVINPPYGERLEEKDEMNLLYNEIGTHLKHFYNGYDAWILSGNMEAIKLVGLKPSKKIKLFNGPIECKLNKYELYKGSKKIIAIE